MFVPTADEHEDECEFEPLAHGIRLMSPEEREARMAKAFEQLKVLNPKL